MKNVHDKYHAPCGRPLRSWELRDHYLRNTDPEFDAEMDELDRRHDALGQAAYRMNQARKKKRGG